MPPTFDTAPDEQRFFRYVVEDHFPACLADTCTEPLRVIISEVAGTGKSWISELVRNLLQENGKFCAYTGAAACLLNDTTIHYLFTLPTHPWQMKKLQGASSSNLQSIWEQHANHPERCYIIIDEMSLLGLKSLFWVNLRMQQVTKCRNDGFGNFSVILTGDHGQLPPLNHDCIWSVPTRSNKYYHNKMIAHYLYRSFKDVVIWTKQFRQKGTRDVDVLWRDTFLALRDGKATIEQIQQTVATRFETKLPRELVAKYHKNEKHLFYKSTFVENYNFYRLIATKQPVIQAHAKHSHVKRNKVVPRDTEQLVPVLTIRIGSLVSLTHNLWAEICLHNGALRTIVDIIYLKGHGPPELQYAVIFNFTKSYRGPSFAPKTASCPWGDECLVPLVPRTAMYKCDGKDESRAQILLALS